MNTVANLLESHMGDAPTKEEHFANPSVDEQRFADQSGEKMLALTWQGKNKVKVQEVPKPKIVEPTDALIKVTGTTVCGSDLHLFHGAIPEMQKGDILGHEYMGVVESVGSKVSKIKVGDRVVASFNVACGECFQCKRGFTSGCTQTNPSKMMEELYGGKTTAILGYSHLTGAISGGQSEYVRQPLADANLFKIPDKIPDEAGLFLSDVLPTSYWCVKDTKVEKGDIVGIWGLGPIGLTAAAWALQAGAARIIGVDNVAWRLEYAKKKFGDKFVPLNFDEHKNAISTRIKELTDPKLLGLDPTRPPGLDVALECAAGEFGAKSLLEKAEVALALETDGSAILNEMITSVIGFGRIGLTGVYAGFVNHLNIGSVMQRGIMLKGNGQSPATALIPEMIEILEKNDIDPIDLFVSHRVPFEDIDKLYGALNNRQEGLIKVFVETKFSNRPSSKAPQSLTQL